VNSNAFGLPDPGETTTFFVAALNRAVRTLAGEAVGWPWR
jgi:hypothetical protein